MKNYLSFGGGVNSVAMHILMLRENIDFEAIFVDHGTDWPETYEYLGIFQDWLSKNRYKNIKILSHKDYGYQDTLRFASLYDYYFSKKAVPSVKMRDCTSKFKIKVIWSYAETPCFMCIGIDAGEAHRAKISIKKGIENRWPLIEYGVDREGCKKIIRDAGLPVPMRSGCYICPFQSAAQWKELRRKHPCLFKRAVELEKSNMEYRKEIGKKSFTISSSKKTLNAIVNEYQEPLWEEDRYPPCQCGL